MQIPQDRHTLRWSKMTLLGDPGAKLIRMQVRVFSDSTWCVGASNPDPSNNWSTKLQDVWNERGFVEKLNLAAREVRFMWHVLLGACTLHIKKHVQKYLNGRKPEYLGERIVSMCMFNGICWTKKGNTETCWHNAEEVAAFATKFEQRHWCFLARVRKYVVETQIPMNFEDTGKLLHCMWLTYSCVKLPTRCFHRQGQCRLERRMQLPFPRYLRDNKKLLIKTSTVVFYVTLLDSAKAKPRSKEDRGIIRRVPGQSEMAKLCRCTPSFE